MNLIKAFVAGVTIPSILLPFMLCLALAFGKSEILMVPFLHFIPLIWGILNILYIVFFKRLFPGDVNTRLQVAGGVLGLLVAIYAIFHLDLPRVFGSPEWLNYAPLIIAPILYAIVWRYLLKPLNTLLGLQN
jgi:hypothetical protein